MIINKQNNTPDELINEITETLNIITKQNYFTYNNKFYTQNEVLPMGSPISVSYTHLDVYKRQMQYNSTYFKCPINVLV